jgi:hypothetical protein
MRWRNLKDGLCPRCSSPLEEHKSALKCSRKDCDFLVSQKRAKEILEGKAFKRYESLEDGIGRFNE